MALNFPSSPTVGQIYYDDTSGFYYEWDGTVWKSYSPSSTGQIKVLDDISSSFDDVTTTFALTSSSVAVSPVNPQQLIINLGGVIQDPANDYSISGSNIEFTTAPQAGLTFSGVSLGPAINLTLTNITSTDDTTTNSEFYPVFVNGTSSTSPTISTPKLIFNPSTGILSATAFEGDGSGLTGIAGTANVSTSTLVVSGVSTHEGNVELKSTSKINAVGVGKNIVFQDNGTDRFHFEMASTGLRPETGNTGSIGNLSYPFSSGVFTNFRVVSDLNVGNNVNITGICTATSFSGDGSGLTGVGATINDDITTNSDMYPVFSSSSSGSLTTAKVSSTKLTYNPSTLMVPPTVTLFWNVETPETFTLLPTFKSLTTLKLVNTPLENG